MNRADGGFIRGSSRSSPQASSPTPWCAWPCPSRDRSSGRSFSPPRLHPLNEMLGRALGGRRGPAALLLTLAGALLYLGPEPVAVAFATQAGDLVASIQEVAERTTSRR